MNKCLVLPCNICVELHHLYQVPGFMPGAEGGGEGRVSWQLMGDFGSEPMKTQLSVCLSWELCCHFGVLKMLLSLPGHQVPAVPGKGLQVAAGHGSWFGLPWLLVWATFPLVSKGHMFLPACGWSCSAHRMEPVQILTWMVLHWLGMCR